MNTCKCLKNKKYVLYWNFGSINNTLHPLNALIVLNSGKRFFRLLKNIIHTKKKHGSFKNCSLKSSLLNQKWSFHGITAKVSFWKIFFLRNESN